MNTNQAKETISIRDYLESKGYRPANRSNKNLLYLSPLRVEKTASFSVNAVKKTFMDWGTGQSGTIIDLVMLLHNTNISGALQILRNYKANSGNSSFFYFSRQNISSVSESIPGKVTKISNEGLIKYLDKRCISKKTWSNCEFLFEYSYPNPKNPTGNQVFYNLAWKNNRGGYELNNFNFKSCLIKKDITTVFGSSNELNVFEGFMDYLSALTYFKINRFKGTTIILNSVSLIERILPGIKAYNSINSYLDNDKSGETVFDIIKIRNTNTINQSKLIYPKFKDFNEYLIHLNKPTR